MQPTLTFGVFLVYFGLLSCTSATSALKILTVYTHPGKSHSDVFDPILRELTSRGHQITTLSHFNHSTPEYHFETLLFDTPINHLDINFDNSADFFGPVVIFKFAYASCVNDLKSKMVHKVLHEKSRHFDLVIVEAFVGDCFVPMGHHFGAPVIHVSSSPLITWFSPRFGQVINPSHVNNFLNAPLFGMSFLEKVKNTLQTGGMIFAYYYFIGMVHHYTSARSVYKNLPSYDDTIQNVSLALVNTHGSLHGAVANVPQIIEIGGVHIAPQTDLPKVNI